MLFNSISFLLFFTIVVILYYTINYKFRWMLLLVSSLIFYMTWNIGFILLLLLSAFINYIISLKIYNTNNKNKKRLYLYIALFVSFGILFVFKYLDFFNSLLESILLFVGIKVSIKKFGLLLPMGISFYTFQTVSYTIDVYKNEIKPQKGFLKLLLFITFFPQLVAGPIERADRLIPQLFTNHKFNINNTLLGIKIMIIGYFKKVVVADRLAIIVNTVYNNCNNYSGLYFVIATVLFAFQIYCDFSAYSEIALGCSKVLGIDLMENFNRPYFSKSIKEFWRRWHISLSIWFRDYLYIPLGGNRVGPIRRKINLLITFLVSGIWHGANLTFVVWGIIHGMYQIIGELTQKYRDKIYVFFRFKETFIEKIIKITITFILVNIAWVFFRANNINDALYIITNLCNDFNNWFSIRYIYETVTSMGVSLFEFIVSVLSVILLVLYETLSNKAWLYLKLENKNFILRGMFYIIILTIILTMGVYHSESQFIYFQF